MAVTTFDKPVGTEIKTLSDQIDISISGSNLATLDSIKTFLTDVIATLDENGYKFVRIRTGTNTSLSPFTAWTDYIGWVQKQNSTGTYWSGHFVGRDGHDVSVGCSGGTITTSSLSDQIGTLQKSMKLIGRRTVNDNSASKTYTIDKTAFGSDAGSYLIVCRDWSTVPKTDVYIVSFSGGVATYCGVYTVIQNSASSKVSVDTTTGKFTVLGSHDCFIIATGGNL